MAQSGPDGGPIVTLYGGFVEPNQDGPAAHEFAGRRYVIAEVEPLDVTGVRTVAVGTALWLVAFVALLPFASTLRETGQLWWLWTCLAGVGLGLCGIEVCRRQARRGPRRASRGKRAR